METRGTMTRLLLAVASRSNTNGVNRKSDNPLRTSPISLLVSRAFGLIVLVLVFALPVASSAQQFVPGELVVGFKRGTSRSTAEAVIAAHTTQIFKEFDFELLEDFEFGRAFLLRFLDPRTVPQVVEEFRQEAAVEYAEPHFIGKLQGHQPVPNDLNGTQWSLINSGQPVAGRAGIIDADVDAQIGRAHV